MEPGSKPELVLFWVRDIDDVYKKENVMLIYSNDIDINEINRIYVVVVSDHGQGAFRFPIKIVFATNNGKRFERIQPAGYLICKKDNGIILKNIITKNLGDSIKLLN